MQSLVNRALLTHMDRAVTRQTRRDCRYAWDADEEPATTDEGVVSVTAIRE